VVILVMWQGGPNNQAKVVDIHIAILYFLFSFNRRLLQSLGVVTETVEIAQVSTSNDYAGLSI